MSVEDTPPLCLVFSTDAVSALWPMWSSGVVQGSLRLSGGGLMVHRLSLCACYGCVYCMCLHARGSIIVILTDTFALCGWRPLSEMADYPSSYHGPTILSRLLHEWLTPLVCFLLFLSPPWCFIAEQTNYTAFHCSLITRLLKFHIWEISASVFMDRNGFVSWSKQVKLCPMCIKSTSKVKQRELMKLSENMLR